jgi:hypothetical protein
VIGRFRIRPVYYCSGTALHGWAFTNGWLLSSKLDQLAAAGLKTAYVSIDSPLISEHQANRGLYGLEVGLVRGDNLSVDGSFVEANANKQSRIPREQLAEAAQVKVNRAPVPGGTGAAEPNRRSSA